MTQLRAGCADQPAPCALLLVGGHTLTHAAADLAPCCRRQLRRRLRRPRGILRHAQALHHRQGSHSGDNGARNICLPCHGPGAPLCGCRSRACTSRHGPEARAPAPRPPAF
jgi:hypothetical protein